MLITFVTNVGHSTCWLQFVHMHMYVGSIRYMNHLGILVMYYRIPLQSPNPQGWRDGSYLDISLIAIPPRALGLPGLPAIPPVQRVILSNPPSCRRPPWDRDELDDLRSRRDCSASIAVREPVGATPKVKMSSHGFGRFGGQDSRSVPLGVWSRGVVRMSGYNLAKCSALGPLSTRAISMTHDGTRYRSHSSEGLSIATPKPGPAIGRSP